MPAIVSAMFQSAPVIADGRTCTSPTVAARHSRFQSAPVIADGRTQTQRFVDSRFSCFNPRPSSLTGELWTGTHTGDF